MPFAPTLLPQVTTPPWTVSTVLYPPSALPLGELIGPTAESTTQVFPPFMVAYAPPAEIHDFTVAITRGTAAVVDVCRGTDSVVGLTRGVTRIIAIDREAEFTAQLIEENVFSVSAER